MGLLNWLFGKVAKDVAVKEYGPGQTAWKPEPDPSVLAEPINPPPEKPQE